MYGDNNDNEIKVIAEKCQNRRYDCERALNQCRRERELMECQLEKETGDLRTLETELSGIQLENSSARLKLESLKNKKDVFVERSKNCHQIRHDLEQERTLLKKTQEEIRHSHAENYLKNFQGFFEKFSLAVDDLDISVKALRNESIVLDEQLSDMTLQLKSLLDSEQEDLIQLQEVNDLTNDLRKEELNQSILDKLDEIKVINMRLGADKEIGLDDANETSTTMKPMQNSEKEAKEAKNLMML